MINPQEMTELQKSSMNSFGMILKIHYLIQQRNPGELSTSKKQAVIKLIEKTDRHKRLIKNWRPISLLNIATKLISMVIATRLKKILNNLISDNQIACLNIRFISEGGRLISDIAEITDLLHIEGILLTVDIEKLLTLSIICFWYLLLKSMGLRTIL